MDLKRKFVIIAAQLTKLNMILCSVLLFVLFFVSSFIQQRAYGFIFLFAAIIIALLIFFFREAQIGQYLRAYRDEALTRYALSEYKGSIDSIRGKSLLFKAVKGFKQDLFNRYKLELAFQTLTNQEFLSFLELVNGDEKGYQLDSTEYWLFRMKTAFFADNYEDVVEAVSRYNDSIAGLPERMKKGKISENEYVTVPIRTAMMSMGIIDKKDFLPIHIRIGNNPEKRLWRGIYDYYRGETESAKCDLKEVIYDGADYNDAKYARKLLGEEGEGIDSFPLTMNFEFLRLLIGVWGVMICAFLVYRCLSGLPVI